MFNLKMLAIFGLLAVLLMVSGSNGQPVYLPSSQAQNRAYIQARHFQIVYRNNVIRDFEYVPTVQGYRYGYVLHDGTLREEMVFLRGDPKGPYAGLDGKNTDLTAVGIGGRPRMPLKNRKLSPKSLQSLAG